MTKHMTGTRKEWLPRLELLKSTQIRRNYGIQHIGSPRQGKEK